MTTEATPREVGSHEWLGLAPERATFDRWLRDNGHCEDQHDDMLMPLQRSLNELMWSAWQAAVAAEREHVRIPTSAAEAKAMATVAIAWLREHAPDELRPEFRA